MKFLDFQKQMQSYPVFSKHDLLLFFPQANVHTLDKQLIVWAGQKKIVKLKNGLYVLSSDYTKEDIAPEIIAAKLYTPSYISLEFAMALYGIIPEAVFEITSITPKPTRLFKTPFGAYRYRKIKPSCFFGFSPVKHGKLTYYLATREKALIDFLYLNSSRFTEDFQNWEDLRLQNLEELDFQAFSEVAKKFKNKKLLKLVFNLKEYATSH